MKSLRISKPALKGSTGLPDRYIRKHITERRTDPSGHFEACEKQPNGAATR